VDLAGETTNLGVSIDGGFLVEHPRVTFTTRRKPKIPYILGANSDEGTLFFIGSPELTETEYSDALVTQFGAFAPEIEALYPVDSFDTPRDALIRVVGDAQLVCGTYDTAARYASKGQKTYVYNFSRVPPLAFIGALDLGAFHGLEIGYVFGSVPAPTQIDQEVGNHVQDYWTSFADRGKPLIPHSTKWPRFKAKTWKLMRLDAPLSLPTDFRRAQCEFWTSYYDTVLP
jgi:para-nitrobenzyl esterase